MMLPPPGKPGSERTDDKIAPPPLDVVGRGSRSIEHVCQRDASGGHKENDDQPTQYQARIIQRPKNGGEHARTRQNRDDRERYRAVQLPDLFEIDLRRSHRAAYGRLAGAEHR